MKYRVLMGALSLAGIIFVNTVNASDCEYVPGTDPGAWLLVPSMVGGAWVYELRASGCMPQCVARVFCKSDHPELHGTDGPISLRDKVGKGQDINCNANPSESPLTPSCPPADECMAAAKKEIFRKAVPTEPAKTGADHFTYEGVDFKVQYGVDRAHPETRIPLYTFPKKNGDATDGCHICASPVTLGELAWDYALCNAGKNPASCSNANDCAAERHGDPGALSVIPVKRDQIVHYTPPVPSGPAPTAGRKSGDAK